MNRRRLAVGGLALFASATVALAGCSSSSSKNSGSAGASASASASASAAVPAGGGGGTGALPGGNTPAEKLTSAAQYLLTTSFKYTLQSSGLSGQGAADPANKKATMTMSGTQDSLAVKLDSVVIGTDAWVKLDVGGKNDMIGIPTKWMHLDQTKMGKDSGLGIDVTGADPSDAAGLFNGLADVKQVDAQHYNVTFDLTKAKGSTVTQDIVSSLGDKAKSVPGTVELDSQGRLSKVNLDLSAIDPSRSVAMSYSDYGTPVSVSAPAAGDTVDAPDAVYQMFTGS